MDYKNLVLFVLACSWPRLYLVNAGYLAGWPKNASPAISWQLQLRAEARAGAAANGGGTMYLLHGLGLACERASESAGVVCCDKCREQ